jgi:tRNA pseudouridine55 synthase
MRFNDYLSTALQTQREQLANESGNINQAFYGLVAIDKPGGISSAKIDYELKRHLALILDLPRKHAPKVGHAGTLDPFATGLLLVGIGNTTKDLHALEKSSKEYIATIRLGWSTPTDDLTSRCTKTPLPLRITEPEIMQAFSKIKGQFMQAPCAFSAKKVDGERAYNLQRHSDKTPTELQKVKVEVYESEILSTKWHTQKLYFDLEVRLNVSSGTYIRAIARDLGEALGIGGHLRSLRRTKVGNYNIEDAVSAEELVAITDKDAFLNRLNRYPAGSSVTIGNFDGVHIGHQSLLEHLQIGAQKRVTVIIDRNSQMDAESKSTTALFGQLTTLRKRRNYIIPQFADECYVLKLREIADVDYREFFQALVENFNMHSFITTQNMEFGRDRQGCSERIKQNFPNIQVVDVQMQSYANSDNMPKSLVSASSIRQMIADGDVKCAKALLGKSYKLQGEVVHGHARGREIGFPTANLSDIATIIPGEGVYYGSLEWSEVHTKERRPAIISIGKNPTFGENAQSVEVNIPDGNFYELYDKIVQVSFDAKMRGMVKFDGVTGLIEQLKYDGSLAMAAHAIASGKLVFLPTDTVPGIVGQFGNFTAFEAIYNLKKRDRKKPLQVMVGSIAEAYLHGFFTPDARKLAEKYCLEEKIPTTLVVPIDKNSDSTIGIRMPSNKLALDLLNLTGPLYASSANLSENAPASNARVAHAIFGNQIAYYLQGELGGAESAIYQGTQYASGSQVLQVEPNGEVTQLR